MGRKTFILDSAREEFRDIGKYVRQAFGDPVWNTVKAEYKEAIRQIGEHPRLGSPIDELKELGMTNIRYLLVRQTKVIYEFDDQRVLIHMFISTKRDFRTHLFKRLVSQ